MEWLNVKGFFVHAKTIEAAGIVSADLSVSGRVMKGYAVIVKSCSGSTYIYRMFVKKHEAEKALKKLYEQLSGGCRVD